MGYKDETNNDRGRVRNDSENSQYRRTNNRNSKGGSSRGKNTKSLRTNNEANKRSSISSSQESMDSVSRNNNSRRVRKSDSNTTKTSSIYSEKMGKKHQKIITVANQKGGVGKTAVIVHLAFFFKEQGYTVSVIDLDTQSNASYTLKEFTLISDMTEVVASSLFENENKFPLKQKDINLISADPKLADIERRDYNVSLSTFKSNIDELLKVSDIILIDTAPSLGASLAFALSISDFVISPIELEIYSLQGIKKMLTVIQKIQLQVNKNLKFLGMLPSKLDNRNARQKENLKDVKAAYPTLLIPTHLSLRSSVADALATHVPVWTIKKTAARKAGKEFKDFGNYVLNKLEN